MGGPSRKRAPVKAKLPGAAGGGSTQPALDECTAPIRVRLAGSQEVASRVAQGMEVWAVPAEGYVEIRTDAQLLARLTGAVSERIVSCASRGYSFRGRVEGVDDSGVNVVLSGEM